MKCQFAAVSSRTAVYLYSFFVSRTYDPVLEAQFQARAPVCRKDLPGASGL